MAKKPNVRGLIKEGKQAIKAIMQEHLALIAEDMIKKIIARTNRLNDSSVLTALNDVPLSGVAAYKENLRTAFALLALEGIETARKQVPMGRRVRLTEYEDSIQLSEFDKLPPKLKRKVQKQLELFSETQVNDLVKVVSFQFTSSIDSTDSVAVVAKDLQDAAEDFIRGSSVDAGAGSVSSSLVNAARQEYFQNVEVFEEVEAFVFVNGDPVSPICQDLAGTIFSKDDPEADRYMPPLHFNCKSYIEPILKGHLKGREIEDLKPSKAGLDKYVQFSEEHFCSHEHL